MRPVFGSITTTAPERRGPAQDAPLALHLVGQRLLHQRLDVGVDARHQRVALLCRHRRWSSRPACPGRRAGRGRCRRCPAAARRTRLQTGATDAVGVAERGVRLLVRGGDGAGVAEDVRRQRAAGVVADGLRLDAHARVLLAVLAQGEHRPGRGRRSPTGTGWYGSPVQHGAGTVGEQGVVCAVSACGRRAEQRRQRRQHRLAVVGLLLQRVPVDGDDVGLPVADEDPALGVDDQAARRGDGDPAVVQHAGALLRLVRVEDLHPVEPTAERHQQ